MVLVTGDLHGNFERFKPKYFPEQARMTKQDIMICTGDFGGLDSRWTGWNACPSRLPSSAEIMRTTTRWNDTLWWNGTAARCIAFALMCCT